MVSHSAFHLGREVQRRIANRGLTPPARPFLVPTLRVGTHLRPLRGPVRRPWASRSACCYRPPKPYRGRIMARLPAFRKDFGLWPGLFMVQNEPAALARRGPWRPTNQEGSFLRKKHARCAATRVQKKRQRSEKKPISDNPMTSARAAKAASNCLRTLRPAPRAFGSLGRGFGVVFFRVAARLGARRRYRTGIPPPKRRGFVAFVPIPKLLCRVSPRLRLSKRTRAPRRAITLTA